MRALPHTYGTQIHKDQVPELGFRLERQLQWTCSISTTYYFTHTFKEIYLHLQ